MSHSIDIESTIDNVSCMFQCSVTCGGDGVQSRRVTCEQGNTHILQDSMCNSTQRPIVRQACNNGPCKTKRRWKVDPWQSVRRNRWYDRYYKMLRDRQYLEQLRIQNQERNRNQQVFDRRKYWSDFYRQQQRRRRF